MSRRSFVALSCAGGVSFAGLALSGCSASEQNQDDLSAVTSFEQEVDEKTVTAEEVFEQRVNTLLGTLTLEQKVAQLFIVRPEDLAGYGSLTRAEDQMREALAARPVGGLIYFEYNLLDSAQTGLMLANTLDCGIQAQGIPPFLCVDEEGGTVTRIGGVFGFDAGNVGDMAAIGATGNPAEAKSAAVTIASYLSPLGFNTNFAPVCDIANNPNSYTMAQRSFGADAHLVASMAAAQVEGFLESGMLCSAKHFPGIGAAIGDSHDAGITTDQTLEGLRATELVPFQAAINAGAPFVMVGHISAPSVTGTNAPASLSPEVVSGLLREEMRYDKIIITDSLGMGAILEWCSVEDVGTLALQAGCDIALLPDNFDAAYNGVLSAIHNGVLSEERINQSVRRILRVKLHALAAHFA